MGLTQTTLVIFTSDHGSLLYDHGGPNDKHTFYDPVWHVPLVVRMPGTLPQNATARFASTVDVTAMLLVAAGVDWEGEANSHIDVYTQASLPNNTMFMAGLDVLTPLKEALTRAKAAGATAATTSATASKGMLLKHLMVGGGKSVNKTSQEEWVGHDFYGEVIAVPRTAVPASEYRGYAVVSEHWKLVYMSEQGEGRLYDRDADPQERTDLFNDPDHASVKNSLLVGLLRWRAQQDDLQWQLSNWKNAADVGNRARNDSFYLTGRQAEYNLQATAAEADALWEAKVFNGKVAVSSQ
jgi:arylsulfatase A-like enzyme